MTPVSPAAVRRSLLRDLDADLARTARGPLKPAAVHVLRKRIKRARAALALLRPALAERDFESCDRSLREAGRSLAPARDATVMAETYARMQARTASVSQPRRWPAVKAPIADRGMDGTVTHGHLRKAIARLAGARLRSRGWAPLGAGVRAVYRRGRRRRPVASRPGTEALHAWRRHTKRYWHVLEWFEAVNPQRMAPAIADARRLSNVLGEEHDLALLAEQLRRRRRRGDEAVLKTITARRARLTRRALALGAKVFDDAPRTVERRLRADWERWRKSS